MHMKHEHSNQPMPEGKNIRTNTKNKMPKVKKSRKYTKILMSMPTRIKICTRCHVSKPVDAFSKKESAKDRLQSPCKECDQEDDRERKRKNVPIRGCSEQQ